MVTGGGTANMEFQALLVFHITICLKDVAVLHTEGIS